MIEVSIIIPVYNVAPYLRCCLDSVVNQTLRDIEIICVDDGSTDDSPEILAEYTARDPRVRVLLQPNSGTVIARKRAIAAARGEWCLFLDPDDWLETGACEGLIAIAHRFSTDIIQYGVVVHEEIPRPRAQQDAVKEYFNKRPGRYGGADLFRMTFLERSMPWNLIGRMVRTEICKCAFAEQIDAYSINETDVYATFHLLARTQTLEVVADSFYHYRYGVGISTKRNLTFDEFSRMMGKFQTCRELKAFAEGAYPEGSDARLAADQIELMMVGTQYASIVSRLACPEDRRRSFSLFLKICDPTVIVRSLAERNEGNHFSLVRRIDSLGGLPPPKAMPDMRRIGFSCRASLAPEILRTLVLLISGFLDHGFGVTAFVYGDGDVLMGILPQGCKVVSVSTQPQTGTAVGRVCKLGAALSTHPVDVLISYDYQDPLLIWDLLVCRLAQKIPFYLHYHGPLTEPLWTQPSVTSYVSQVSLLRLCDGVLSADYVDAYVLRAEGVHAQWMPCLLSPEIIASMKRPIPAKSGGMILWTGMLNASSHPGEAVHIFARVQRVLPGVRLIMLGEGSERAFSDLEKLVASECLPNSVTIMRRPSHPISAFSSADLFLVTSDFEGYAADVLTAPSQGALIVGYEHPQLPFLSDEYIAKMVPPRDVSAAVGAICKLLGDARSLEMREVARRIVGQYAIADATEAWLQVFRGNSIGRRSEDNEAPSIFLRMLNRGLSALHLTHSAQMSSLADQRQKVRDQLMVKERELVAAKTAVARIPSLERRSAEFEARVVEQSRANEALVEKCAGLEVEQGVLRSNLVDQGAKNEELRQRLADVEKSAARLREQLLAERRRSEELKRTLTGILSSRTYRIGRILTWPVRIVARSF